MEYLENLIKGINTGIEWQYITWNRKVPKWVCAGFSLICAPINILISLGLLIFNRDLLIDMYLDIEDDIEDYYENRA